jgi:hypothetical protein
MDALDRSVRPVSENLNERQRTGRLDIVAGRVPGSECLGYLRRNIGTT